MFRGAKSNPTGRCSSWTEHSWNGNSLDNNYHLKFQFLAISCRTVGKKCSPPENKSGNPWLTLDHFLDRQLELVTPSTNSTCWSHSWSNKQVARTTLFAQNWSFQLPLAPVNSCPSAAASHPFLATHRYKLSVMRYQRTQNNFVYSTDLAGWHARSPIRISTTRGQLLLDTRIVCYKGTPIYDINSCLSAWVLEQPS